MTDTPAEVPAPDILKELRDKDAAWQQDCNRWILEAGEGVTPDVEASMRSTLWGRAANKIDRLTAEVERLRAALEWYADGSNCSNPFGMSSIIYEGGKIARAALTQEPRT